MMKMNKLVVEKMKSVFLCRLAFVLVALMILLSLPAEAEWIQVTGKASLEHGRYDIAREQAMRDAIRQASLQFGVDVESQQRLKNGSFQEDALTLSSRGQVRQSVIQREYQENGFLMLTVNLDMVPQALCETSQASQYKKKVAVLGFSLQAPAQANLGGIADIERALAGQLSQQLKVQNRVVVFEQSQVAIHGDYRNAPSHYTQQLTLSHAAEYAKQAGVQFVVSGIIRDLSVEDPRAFATDYWTKLKRMTNQANQYRRFSVDLFIHDGFSGALIWQKQFSAKGKWDLALNEKVGFDSPALLASDYGQQVSRLIGYMAEHVEEQLQCQPFMARITRSEGKHLYFSVGASSGIRPGDSFALYRTANFYDADRLSGIDLENVKVALKVTQVHPEFSSGTISVDPGRLNIQEDDLLIAW